MPKNDKDGKTLEETILFIYKDNHSREYPFNFSYSSDQYETCYGFGSFAEMARSLFAKIVAGFIRPPAILLNRIPDSLIVKLKKQRKPIDRYSPLSDDYFSSLQNFFKVS